MGPNTNGPVRQSNSGTRICYATVGRTGYWAAVGSASSSGGQQGSNYTITFSLRFAGVAQYTSSFTQFGSNQGAGGAVATTNPVLISNGQLIELYFTGGPQIDWEVCNIRAWFVPTPAYPR